MRSIPALESRLAALTGSCRPREGSAVFVSLVLVAVGAMFDFQFEPNVSFCVTLAELVGEEG